ncbi:SprT-like metalloprotease [Cryptosporidium canis]|uniref:SprT-like metalloprotease n=1 Tax=Cryptosporidium canis TaxID=195482 RepID=A0ABQ8P2V8_9CRYT|nr:SprT-like metalloprotease [Cryptosporidium canis]KAJ1614237.1 SprT-like metalloprotease [Cryptosporidium canis]
MTLCAGKCTYEIGGRCVVSLSEPLLKYRSVKELKETILHELIHAYLFLTSNNRDRNSHGKEFRFHMDRINKLSGLNITIYHNFRDELEYYRRYVWRCNGVCRNNPPYFGYIRRSIKREPGPADSWWNNHERECGGRFIREANIKFQATGSAFIGGGSAGQVQNPSSNKLDVIEIVEISD